MASSYIPPKKDYIGYLGEFIAQKTAQSLVPSFVDIDAMYPDGDDEDEYFCYVCDEPEELCECEPVPTPAEEKPSLESMLDKEWEDLPQ